MARRLSIFSATILVLLNFVVSSPALHVIDTSKQDKAILVFNENDIAIDEQQVPQLQKDREPTFVGDFVGGARRLDEDEWQQSFPILNHLDQFFSIALELTVHGRKIHYVGVFNEEGSEAVACTSPYVLGGPTAEFTIRVKPQSESFVTVIIASHY